MECGWGSMRFEARSGHSVVANGRHSRFSSLSGVRCRLSYKTNRTVVYGFIATTGGSKSALIFTYYIYTRCSSQ
jgi:hypothetical protein